ncbi:MAG: hypothetical protein ACE5GE_08075 [Phycisphaerae bacterium]
MSIAAMGIALTLLSSGAVEPGQVSARRDAQIAKPMPEVSAAPILHDADGNPVAGGSLQVGRVPDVYIIPSWERYNENGTLTMAGLLISDGAEAEVEISFQVAGDGVYYPLKRDDSIVVWSSGTVNDAIRFLSNNNFERAIDLTKETLPEGRYDAMALVHQGTNVLLVTFDGDDATVYWAGRQAPGLDEWSRSHLGGVQVAAFTLESALDAGEGRPIPGAAIFTCCITCGGPGQCCCTGSTGCTRGDRQAVCEGGGSCSCSGSGCSCGG